MALAAWRKRENIELLRTIAIVTASVNPEKAQQALQRLIEEMFPEVAKDRAHSVDKALEIMERETKRLYKVTPVGQSLKKTPFARVQSILKNKRKPRKGDGD